MRAITVSVALALGLVAASTNAIAQRLDTFAGSLDLPFTFHVLQRVDRAGNSALEFSTHQRWQIAVDSGALAGKEAFVEADYWLPARTPVADRLRELLQQKGVRDVHAAMLSTYPASIFGRQWRDAGGDDRMASVLVGTINNALLTVRIESHGDTSFDPATAQAIAGFALDFDSVLSGRSRFDAAAREASAGRTMRSATGDYVIAGLTPRLGTVSTWFGADGRVQAERTSYSFARAGFWRGDLMSFASACGIAGSADAERRLQRFEPDSTFARVTTAGEPEPARIGGLEARTIPFTLVSTHAPFGSQQTGEHWLATSGDRWYAFDFISNDGSSFAQTLKAQVDARPLDCMPRALLTLDPAPVKASP